MEQNQWTVSQVVNSVKDILEREFRLLSVIGEVSNFSLSSTGHCYFTLSDESSSLSAVIFKVDALRNPFLKEIKNGDKVLCVGSLGVYTKRGTFQLIARRITPVGKGNLKEQFEKLKRKLAAEGLFDIENKKPIPRFPKRVAIITAERGAALQDFINIYARRSLWMDLVVIPTLVQGDAAAEKIRESLIRVIKYSMDAPENQKIDLIVLTRGGGSVEDLWAFNDEALAWEIFNSPIPTISAVGHQVDYSICDFVADLRCETPSAAAEIITEEQTKLKRRLSESRRSLAKNIQYFQSSYKERLSQVHPRIVLDKIWNQFYFFQERLHRCNLKNRSFDLVRLHELQWRLDDNFSKFENKVKENLKSYSNKIEHAQEMLRVLNPSNILVRGYCVMKNKENQVVSSLKSFEKQDEKKPLSIMFHDGNASVYKERNSD